MASDKSELMEVFESMLQGKVGSYILTSVVAMGSFGAVFCGEHEKTEMLAAIKCLFKKGLTPKQMEIQRTELTLNQQIGSHPHICSLLEPVETDEHLFLIFEFCENGDLFDLIRENKLPTPDRAKQLFLQAIAGIEHCHTRGVFHRDLKPENLLLTMGKIKIADFGLASTEPYPRELGVGSPPYMGPELFDKSLDSYSAPKSDIWALGVIFFNMLYQVNPWETAVPTDPHYAAHLKDPQGSLKRRFNLSDQLARIFTAVFEPNFSKRCSLKELRAMVLALDFPAPPAPVSPAPAPKSQGFFSWFSSSSSSLLSSSTTTTTTSSPASASSTTTTSSFSTPSPSAPISSTPSALSKALASSPASKPLAINTPPPSSTTSTSQAALSSSVASDSSFKSALSSSFTNRGTTPVSIRSSVPKNSSQDTFSSSFASSWADDDGEMDFDSLPDLDDNDRDSPSLNSDAYGSLDSSQGSFVEDHATLHPTSTSTSTASLALATSSPQATPTLPPSSAKPRKHSPSSPKAGGNPQRRNGGGQRSDRSRARGAKRHEESDRHSSDDERSSPSLKQPQAHHRRQNSDDHLFAFDEDWHNTLPTPGAQATPGGLKGSSPALGNRRASPANTPKVTSSQPVRRKSAAGLTSTFVPLPNHGQGQPTASGSRTTLGFNTPQPRPTSSSPSHHSHHPPHSSHSSSLPSRPHGGAHAPHKADLSFIPSVNAELALNGIAHIYDRPRTIHALSSQ